MVQGPSFRKVKVAAAANFIFHLQDGATWGAPQATQVADRWHILSNLGDAVEEFLIRAHIRLPDKAAASEEHEEGDKPLSSFSATKACQRKSQARLLRKWKLYQRVQ